MRSLRSPLLALAFTLPLLLAPSRSTAEVAPTEDAYARFLRQTAGGTDGFAAPPPRERDALPLGMPRPVERTASLGTGLAPSWGGPPHTGSAPPVSPATRRHAWNGPPPANQFGASPYDALVAQPHPHHEPVSTACGIDGGCCPNPYCDGCDVCDQPWTWHFMPPGVLFRSYLAGPKESRMGATWVYREDNSEWLMDGTIGGKFALARYGTTGRFAQGYELGFEAAALLRMNWTQELDMDSTDYRFGIPLTYSVGRWQWRFGYYHLSSHVGDEFLVRNNTLVRENYIRDSLNLGLAYFLTEDLRVYGEASWAFHSPAGAEAWHFQFGFDYSPITCGPGGAPFFAANGLLRQEVNFGGGLNIVAGWQWQNPCWDHLLRIGVRYYNGESTHYSFFDEHEELIGAGLWYDY